MKVWMLALSFVAVLGFTGLANARVAKRGGGIRGTITAVDGATFTMTTGASKKNPNATVMTYKVDTSAATVTGTIAVGANVSVVGSSSPQFIGGQTIQILKATTVKVSGGKKKKTSST